MKVLICGSRHWPRDLDEFIEIAIDEHISPGDVIVCGGARGVDSAAASIGRIKGLEVQEHVAEWSRFGRAAGILRNSKMLDSLVEGDEVWGFFLRGVESPGTNDMVRQSRYKFKVRKFVVDQETEEVAHYETPANKEKSSG